MAKRLQEAENAKSLSKIIWQPSKSSQQREEIAVNTKLKFLIGLEKSNVLAQLLFLVSAILLKWSYILCFFVCLHISTMVFYFFWADKIIPPTFTKTLKKVDGNVGGTIQLECKVSGSQPITISWFKEGNDITTGTKYKTEMKESTAILKITDLETSDAGVFTCHATNAAGHSETSGTVSVKG